MNISNNYLSGLCDEANLDPGTILDTDEGLKIWLPHPTSMIIFTAAILWVIDDTELVTELLGGYEYKELPTQLAYSVELTWPGIRALDWQAAA